MSDPKPVSMKTRKTPEWMIAAGLRVPDGTLGSNLLGVDVSSHVMWDSEWANKPDDEKQKRLDVFQYMVDGCMLAAPHPTIRKYRVWMAAYGSFSGLRETHEERGKEMATALEELGKCVSSAYGAWDGWEDDAIFLIKYGAYGAEL